MAFPKWKGPLAPRDRQGSPKAQRSPERFSQLLNEILEARQASAVAAFLAELVAHRVRP
jgi:hypothetical protein